MKRIIASLCLAASLSAHADDTWTGADKKLHFAVSFMAGVATANQWPDNKPLAIGVAMLPGLVKEAMDAQKGGSGFSGKDLVADALGAVAGVYTTHWLIARQNGQTVVAYRAEF